MRTTLNINDELYRAIRMRAAESGRTVTQVVEEALVAALARHQNVNGGAYKFDPKVVRGSAPPRVPIADRSLLHDFMDEGE